MNTKSIYGDKKKVGINHLYTFSVLVENNVGVLNAITIIFTRRRINIESINVAAPNSNQGMGQITIETHTSYEMAEKLVKQIERIIDVIDVVAYEQDEVIHHEIGLYKLPTEAFFNNSKIEKLMLNNNARILNIEKNYVIIEKTGNEAEVKQLFHDFKPFGVLEFVRSGRIAISKSAQRTTSFFKKLEDSNYKVVNL